MITVTINNQKVEIENGATILDAANKADIHIPTLCYMNLHGTENKIGTCRVCVVEVEGRKNLVPACCTESLDGMVVHTNSLRVIKARRTVVELLLSDHPNECLTCARNQNCELQALAAEMGIRKIKYQGVQSKYEKDTSSYSIIRDPNKCILCHHCETMCNNIQTVGVYSAVNRGFDTVVSTAFDMPMMETSCTFCGQCVSVCPTGALTLVSHTDEVWEALDNKDKVVMVQTAPAVRVALGDEFGLESGARVTGKMAAALRRMGFDKVYDTDFAADLTIMEEAAELISRVKNGGPLPLITSCCPAWVKFIEHQFPYLLHLPSTCKSPHEMLGPIAKTYLAEKMGIDPDKIVVVSIMPCLAKKYEANRPEHGYKEGHPYVDYVLSTRELAEMIREAGIDFKNLPDEDFDSVMGESTGASVIFGASGGVMEAALRTAAEWISGKKLQSVEFNDVRGMDGIKEAKVKIGDLELNIAVTNGLGSARKILEKIEAGEANYQAIEVMACPGGCVGGGGQPYGNNKLPILEKRAAGLYAEDRDKPIRLSHENKEIKQLYAEFLGEPNSHKAHELLHTTYTKRTKE